MQKEIRNVLRGLRGYADPPSSFTMVQRNHIRVSWDMTNDDGERVTIRTTIGSSPSDPYWMKSHKKQLQQRFKELNIPTEVNHI